jgi:adenosine deaminase
MIDPQIPFIDLHRHLDGSIRLETILDLGRKHNLRLPAREVDSLRPHVQVTEPQPGVMAFIAKFQWMVGVLVDYQACYRVAYENVVDSQGEGLDYVELRFSPWFMAEPHGLDASGVIEAVVDGVQAACMDTGMKANLIGILSRTYGPQIAWRELEALLRYREQFVALDLAGDEANFPGELFSDHFRKGREAGWQITVHAGESLGPESVWQAIRDLGAVRIGHAVHAPDDDRLLDYMVENRIGIESNLTINTDDPGISGIDLAHEYEIAAPAAGLGRELIDQVQRNALQVAFLSTEERSALTIKKSKNHFE